MNRLPGKLAAGVLALAIVVVIGLVRTLPPDEADLLGKLHSGSESDRVAAIDALGEQGKEIDGAVPALVEQLRADEPVVRPRMPLRGGRGRRGRRRDPVPGPGRPAGDRGRVPDPPVRLGPGAGSGRGGAAGLARRESRRRSGDLRTGRRGEGVRGSRRDPRGTSP